MKSNRVKEFRTRKGLSQGQLARAAGTTLQHIHRIETATIAARLDLASRLSANLDVSLDTLFPGSARIIQSLRSEFDSSSYVPTRTYAELSELGLEADVSTWHLKALLRGHEEPLIFKLPPAEARRLRGAIQREQGELSFVVFDTITARIAINLGELVFCHFLFDVGATDDEDADEDSGVEIYFAGRAKRFDFDPEADYPDEDEVVDRGDFNNIFGDLELDPERHMRLRFTDADGEDVFLRAGDLALLKVPLWVVKPDLLDSDEETAEIPSENA